MSTSFPTEFTAYTQESRPPCSWLAVGSLIASLVALIPLLMPVVPAQYTAGSTTFEVFNLLLERFGLLPLFVLPCFSLVLACIAGARVSRSAGAMTGESWARQALQLSLLWLIPLTMFAAVRTLL